MAKLYETDNDDRDDKEVGPRPTSCSPANGNRPTSTITRRSHFPPLHGARPWGTRGAWSSSSLSVIATWACCPALGDSTRSGMSESVDTHGATGT